VGLVVQIEAVGDELVDVDFGRTIAATVATVSTGTATAITTSVTTGTFASAVASITPTRTTTACGTVATRRASAAGCALFAYWPVTLWSGVG
jgi:hypothetical protein